MLLVYSLRLWFICCEMEKCTAENEKSIRSDYGIILYYVSRKEMSMSTLIERFNDSFNISTKSERYLPMFRSDCHVEVQVLIWTNSYLFFIFTNLIHFHSNNWKYSNFVHQQLIIGCYAVDSLLAGVEVIMFAKSVATGGGSGISLVASNALYVKYADIKNIPVYLLLVRCKKKHTQKSMNT